MTSSANPIRVLLADDQELVRLGFRMILDAEDDIMVVGEASNGEEATTFVTGTETDIILMDVRMPVVDGIEATRRIVSSHPDSRIVILTTFDLDQYAFAALRAGASGFLLKGCTPHELISAIRAVAAGDAAISSRVTRSMLELFATRLPDSDATSSRPENDPTDVLTPRERDVFLAIAEGLTNGEISDRFFLTESTVKTHVGRVLAKLELRDRVHAVIFAYEHDLIARS